MKVFCAWCLTTIKTGDENEGISHGICDQCLADQMKNNLKKNLSTEK